MPTEIPGAACADCKVIGVCICDLKQRHAPRCRFLLAAKLGVPVICDHGFQACPECDPCSCDPPVAEEPLAV